MRGLLVTHFAWLQSM